MLYRGFIYLFRRGTVYINKHS